MVTAQQPNQRVCGRELRFAGSNSDKGRLTTVLYETIDTWKQFRFRIENQTCVLMYDGVEEEFAGLPEALERVDVLQEQDQVAMQEEDLSTYSDQYFMVGLRRNNDSMMRAKSLENKRFFATKVRFYADELVRRGRLIKTPEGKYRKPEKESV
jgi:hypothetical protein